MRSQSFAVALGVALGCSCAGGVEGGESAGTGLDGGSPERVDAGGVDAGGFDGGGIDGGGFDGGGFDGGGFDGGGIDGGVFDAGFDDTDGGDPFLVMGLCAPGVIRPGERVFVEAHPVPDPDVFVVTRASATGPCSIVDASWADGFTFGIPFELAATAPGTCEVEITIHGVVASTDARHEYRGTKRISIEDAPGLRESTETPVHPVFCDTRDNFDVDVPMFVGGRRWCRSFVRLSVTEPGVEPVVIGQEHVVALVDETTVLTRDLVDSDLFRLRDTLGGLLSDFRTRGGTWQSDGRGRLVRLTEPTQDLVRLEWFTVSGGALTAGAVEEVPMKTDGPVRYWSGALMSAIPDVPGGSYYVGWRFHDRTSGHVVHEIPVVYATEVLALDALVLGNRLYTSLEDLVAGNGRVLAGGVVEDGQVEGARRFVTLNSLQCLRTAEVSLYDFDGDVTELGRGHVFFWEPLARFVAYDEGILWAETWGWTGYLAPVTAP